MNFRSWKNGTVLTFAAMAMIPCSAVDTATRCADLVRLLVEAGADVNATNDDGLAPLHGFAKYARSDILAPVVDVLVDAGADPRVRDLFGLEPIHYAVAFGDAEDVPTLVQSGADVNSRMGSSTPLHIAILRGCGGFYLNADSSMLCKSGRPDKLASGKVKSLYRKIAQCEDTEDLAQALIDAGSDVNAYSDCGLTPLHVAALGKTGPRFLDRLLANGANPCKADCYGHLPVDYARENRAIFATQAYDHLSAGTSECERIIEAERDSIVQATSSCMCTGNLVGVNELVDWLDRAS